ncbi:Uncharacterised protein [Pseudomonas fluorescens]|uniref:Uncharacterized protein n=1 Tax=Pseudomonas fluorescens TaxID=294 RepID=A0A3S4SSY5_PSEFL|nr:hypothetical protein [Pseudomonas fluorescens]VEF06293.1 Uncharacterised protein [Pseudomonas fluorescens]
MIQLSRKRFLIILAAALTAAAIAYSNWSTDTLRVHIGKTYDETVADSTLDVPAHTVIYPGNPPHPSSAWISTPVIIHFDDPEHGFKLPVTKFVSIGFDEGKVSNMTTSPMLETLPFDQLIVVLDQLQSQLTNAGWAEWNSETNPWLNTADEASRKTLQAELFDHVMVTVLLIPHKYSLALNVKCYARCDERDPNTAKYLIDVSVGKDYYSE